jgi:Sec-independent protein translocase protein TatA
MEILGIGPLELFFIVIIALIVLGPKDMVKAGKTIGNTLRKVVSSSSWHTIQQASRDLKHLPNKLMTEAGLDEIEKELGVNKISEELKDIEKDIKKDMDIAQIDKELKEVHKDISDWTTPPSESINKQPDVQKTEEILSESGNVPDNNLPAQSQSTPTS